MKFYILGANFKKPNSALNTVFEMVIAAKEEKNHLVKIQFT